MCLFFLLLQKPPMPKFGYALERERGRERRTDEQVHTRVAAKRRSLSRMPARN